MRIECPNCGFSTAFVVDGEILRRDETVHGNRADTRTCFNCNFPLPLPPASRAPAKTGDTDEPAPQPAAPPKPKARPRAKPKNKE